MIKKYLKYGIIVLILVIGVVLLTGCGEQAEEKENTSEPPVKEEVQSNVLETPELKLTLAEGWEKVEPRMTEHTIVIEKTDSEEFFKPEIKATGADFSTPKSQIESWQSIYSDGKVIDNVTINGIEYLVLRRDTNTGVYIHLATSLGDTLKPDEKGYVTIELSHIEIDDAKPILESIVIKTPEAM